MKLMDVLAILKDNGHPLTRASLYRSGIKNGYLTREPYGNTYRYTLNEEKFREWLNKAKTEAPSDMMTLLQVAEKLNVSYATLKSMCNSGELKSSNYGAGEGVTYVKLGDAENAIQIHKQNN